MCVVVGVGWIACLMVGVMMGGRCGWVLGAGVGVVVDVVASGGGRCISGRVVLLVIINALENITTVSSMHYFNQSNCQPNNSLFIKLVCIKFCIMLCIGSCSKM